MFKVRDEMKLNNQALAKALNISPSTISMIEAGKRRVGRKIISSLQRRLCVNPTWLATGQGTMFLGDKPLDASNEVPEGFVSIPLYDVHAAAGSGSIIETEHVKTMMSFSRSVLEELNVPPKSLACLYVSGDSMEPTIRAGELVVIDTSDTTFTFDGGVYILRIDSTLLIKRLIRKSAEEIEVVSDNKERGSFKISTKEIDGNYAIVGRVVLGWRRL